MTPEFPDKANFALYATLTYNRHMDTQILKQTAKDHRIAARVTGEHKSLFEQAAALKGLSLTDFMISAAYDAALKVLADSQIVLELGPEDSRVFVKSILQPREPTELPELQAAIQQ
jgi:uncharacterized protein (DUF1778 family)